MTLKVKAQEKLQKIGTHAGKEVKRVTSTDSGDIEDPENPSSGAGTNNGGNVPTGDFPGEGD